MVNNLPMHGPVLQLTDFVDGPSQSFPFIQTRSLVFIPSPQVVEHSDQALQVP